MPLGAWAHHQVNATEPVVSVTVVCDPEAADSPEPAPCPASEYNQYFAANAPIEQPTMTQIAALLTEQSADAAGPGPGCSSPSLTSPASRRGLVVGWPESAPPIEHPQTSQRSGGAVYTFPQKQATIELIMASGHSGTPPR